MRYKKWTATDIEYVRQYVDTTMAPYNYVTMKMLAKKLDRQVGSIRGVIRRCIEEADQRELDRSQGR